MSLLDWLEWLFGGDAPERPLALGQIAMRTLVVYLGGLILVRLGKSRLLGQSTALDILLALLLGSLLSRGITGSASISGTLVASAAAIALHALLTAWTRRSHRAGKLIKGHSRQLVRDGQIDEAALRHSHLSHEDLMEGIRLNGNVNDLSQIQSAHKERSGHISVVLARSGPRTIRIELDD